MTRKAEQEALARAALGKVIRARRLECGITQEALADRSETHRTYISLVERGLRSPTALVLWAVARGLEIPFSELMDDIGRALKKAGL